MSLKIKNTIMKYLKNNFFSEISFLLIFFLFFIFKNYLFAQTKPLTLKESLEIAFEKSPQLKLAQEKLKSASAKLGQAYSLGIPHLGLDASYGKNYQQPVKVSVNIPGLPPMNFTTTPDEPSKVTTYSASLRQNIFTGGKILLAIDTADSGYKMAEEDYKKVKSELIFSVTEAYFNVLKAEKILAVTDEACNNLEKYFKQIKIFYDAGLSTKAEVLRVEAELAGLRTAKIQAKNGVELAKLAFNSLLGKDLREDIVLAEYDFTSKNENLPELEKLLTISYQKRPEWRAFLSGKKIMKNAVGYAYSGYLPNFALVGSIGKTITEYSDAKIKYDLDNWRVLIVGSWNIFDGLETPFKVAEAKANLSAIEAQEQTLRDLINLEVTSAYMNFVAQKEKLVSSEIAEDLAKKAYLLAEINFKAHIGTNLSLLEAQTALHRAQTNLWVSRFDLEIARAKLNKAVGIEVI